MTEEERLKMFIERRAWPMTIASLKRIAHTADFYLKVNKDPDVRLGLEQIYVEAAGMASLLEGKEE